jgi:hypothetical protein
MEMESPELTNPSSTELQEIESTEQTDNNTRIESAEEVQHNMNNDEENRTEEKENAVPPPIKPKKRVRFVEPENSRPSKRTDHKESTQALKRGFYEVQTILGVRFPKKVNCRVCLLAHMS